MPLALAAGAIFLERKWAGLPAPGGLNRYLNGANGLIALLAFGPLLILALLAQFRPILNQRGLLFASPYLLLLLAIGSLELRRRIGFSWSSRCWRSAVPPAWLRIARMTVDPADYAQFASAVKAEIRATDLVFIRKAWYETPILYYLHAGQYQLVGRDYAQAPGATRTARVWVVLLYDPDPTDEMMRALPGYQAVRTITAPHAKAILYQGPVGRLAPCA